MRLVYQDFQTIADTATGTFRLNAGADTHRVTVQGTGSGSVQVVINGSTSHEAYTLTNCTRVLEISGVEEIQIAASGGSIDAGVWSYRG